MKNALYLLREKNLLDNNYMIKSEGSENPKLPTKCTLYKKHAELEKYKLKSDLTNFTFKKTAGKHY